MWAARANGDPVAAADGGDPEDVRVTPDGRRVVTAGTFRRGGALGLVNPQDVGLLGYDA